MSSDNLQDIYVCIDLEKQYTVKSNRDRKVQTIKTKNHKTNQYTLMCTEQCTNMRNAMQAIKNLKLKHGFI